ncbi:hypothetical protein LUZ60_007138 [Juncus effusus]|nr:hypothetical protein LUZ60_007138 [Juncus effusus]
MAVDPPLAPLIASQLKFLLSNSSLPIKVDQISSGCRNGRYSDRFTLLIPFCLDFVKWEVIFNAYQPSAPPDFVFSEQDEDFNPLLEASGSEQMETNDGLVVLSPFADWNSLDPSKLLTLILHLRDLYVNHHKKRVVQIQDERLKFEINTVLSREGIELCLVSFPEKDEVKFSVPITDLDFYKLVPASNWKQEQKIFLQVVYPVVKSYITIPSSPKIKLVSTAEMKQFFNVDEIRLTSWSDQMSMVAYLYDLEEKLKEQVVVAAADIGKRRRFIEALASNLGRPIEADPVFYRRASLLCQSGVFSFMVHITIPLQFPNKQPILKLESSQHFNTNCLPVMSTPISDYPWSPRWDNTEMADRIFDFLADECLNFKKYCNELNA